MSNDPRDNQRNLFVISSPSGGGKTTIIKQVLKICPRVGFSVSVTTRPSRKGETEGVEYWFTSREHFQKMIAEGRFVEYEEVYGEFYGTPKEPVERALAAGEKMIFDLDVKGGLHFKELFPGSTLIFIKPPSLETLRQRLIERGNITAEALQRRLEKAEMEMEKAAHFDHIVVNDELETAVEEVAKIVCGTGKEKIPGYPLLKS